MAAPGERASNIIPALLDALWPAEVPGYVKLWAIADAAAEPRVPLLVRSTVREACCLYSGQVPPGLAEVAPHLLQIQPNDSVTRDLLGLCWRRNAAVFLRAEEPFGVLRRHFASLLKVRGGRGIVHLFRFYDPRILRAYLPTCTPAELAVFFGPVRSFVVADEDPAVLLEFSRDGGRLAVNRRTLPVRARR
ncbi:MAG TPA: DUF4123 domain-containing protein [Arenibaculum sp.]|nr:DUF4123 domain-containing protein [Arenibaculum sp.]